MDRVRSDDQSDVSPAGRADVSHAGRVDVSPARRVDDSPAGQSDGSAEKPVDTPRTPRSLTIGVELDRKEGGGRNHEIRH